MKALVFTGAGEMPLQDRPDPVPAEGEVLVAVRAAGICGSDVHGYLGLTGRRRPGVIMGHEAAGEVVETGSGVTSARAGDRVILRSLVPCGRCDRCRHGQPNICPDRRGLGMHFDGAYAERVVVPEAFLLPMPANMSFEEAAMVEPLAIAMHAVNITPFALQDAVVVLGAGAIGLLAVLAVRRRGAGLIVVTDRSAHRLAVARSLGADLAIDIAAQDPVEAVMAVTDGRGADAVLEAVGIAATAGQSLRVARSGGNVTWIGNSAPTVELSMQELVTREITLRGSYGFVDEFERAADAIAAGTFDVAPLIERRAPLDEGPEVFRALGSGELDAVKAVLLPNG